MSTLTLDQEQAITDLLATVPHLATGLGTKTSPCSVAAINLALSGRLTDTIPECMSLVVGRWIIRIQDRMPAEIRDSPEWRALLPLAAGTGRDPAAEQARRALLLDHMWGTALPLVQPVADRHGFGPEWAAMCTQQTAASASTAAYAASASPADAAAAYAYAASAAAYAYAASADAYAAAYVAASAASAYAAASAASAYAAYAYAADAAASASAAAYAAADAADAAYAADAASDAAFAYAWRQMDAPALLAQLCAAS